MVRFTPLSDKNYSDGTKVVKSEGKIITSEDSGFERNAEIKVPNGINVEADGTKPAYTNIIESGMSGEKYSENNEYGEQSSDNSGYWEKLNETLSGGVTDASKTLSSMGTNLLKNSYIGGLVDEYAGVSSALGDSTTQENLDSFYGVGDSNNNNYNKDALLLNIQTLKNGISKTAAVKKNDLTPYLKIGRASCRERV